MDFFDFIIKSLSLIFIFTLFYLVFSFVKDTGNEINKYIFKNDREFVVKEYKYLWFNLFLSVILFLTVIFINKKINFILFCIICGYYLILISSNFLMSRYFKNADMILITVINILILIGLVFIYRIDQRLSLRQLFFIIIGYFMYFGIMFIVNCSKNFYKFKWTYFFITIILMSLSLIFGKYINGSKNWISIFGITFQPSEFGKIFLVMYVVSTLSDKRSKLDKIAALALLFLVFIFMFFQKDLGTLLIIFGVTICLYFIKTYKYKLILFGAFISSVISFLAYRLFPHVRVRIKAWLNPESDPSGASYQVLQGFYAMGSGGILGRGLYNGYPSFIPVNTTDYIFVVIIEELGIITGVIIVLVYFIIFFRIIRRVVFVKRDFQKSLILCGFSILITIQMLLIIGGILNLIPLTGVTLPFVSYGGSSIISMFVILGIVQKTLEGIKQDE